MQSSICFLSQIFGLILKIVLFVTASLESEYVAKYFVVDLPTALITTL